LSFAWDFFLAALTRALDRKVCISVEEVADDEESFWGICGRADELALLVASC
jgi:hypothetical protein